MSGKVSRFVVPNPVNNSTERTKSQGRLWHVTVDSTLPILAQIVTVLKMHYN